MREVIKVLINDVVENFYQRPYYSPRLLPAIIPGEYRKVWSYVGGNVGIVPDYTVPGVAEQVTRENLLFELENASGSNYRYAVWNYNRQLEQMHSDPIADAMYGVGWERNVP